MALPTYDKSKRKQSIQQLPKGAYVVKILNAKMDKWPSGDEYIKISFDIAEGEYKDFYRAQYDRNTSEDKKWPFDAAFNVNVPTDSSEERTWNKWNTFFADLEDSNNGFVFSGDLSSLKGKVIGGKFHIKQTESNGTIYDHTQLLFTCVADLVRSGKYGKLPNDKLISSSPRQSAPTDPNGFMDIPAGSNEEVPW